MAYVAGLVLLLLAASPGPARAANSVLTELEAPWQALPIILEASEYLASEDPALFWRFIMAMRDAHTRPTEREKYELVKSVAQTMLTPMQNDIFKFSLAAHTKAPAVQALLQVALEELTARNATSTVQGCDAFVAVDGAFTCSPAAVKALLNPTAAANVTLLDIDHCSSPPREGRSLLVLYGEIGTKSFWDLYSPLADLARDLSLSLCMRHHLVSHQPRGQQLLSGYGVELAIKKAEYTVVDDSQIAGEQEEVREAQEGGEDEFGGFLFSTLARKHPAHTASLQALRRHLVDNAAVITPLKVWELQDVAALAAERVVASPHPLRMLTDLSQNYPTIAQVLSKAEANQTIRAAITQAQQMLGPLGVPEGSPLFLLNSLPLEADNINLFSLLSLLRSESRVLSGLAALGVPVGSMHDILALTPSSAPQQGEPATMLDTRSPAVHFLNDLEKDSRYGRWPRMLMELLRPAHPSQLRYIARNVFTTVLVVDPTTLDGIRLLHQALDLVQNNMPARIGFVLWSPPSSPALGEVTLEGSPKAKSDPSLVTLLGRALAYWTETKGSGPAGVKFVSLLQKIKKSLTAKRVQSAFSSMEDEDTWKEINADSKYDEPLQAMRAWVEDSGIPASSVPALFVNGLQSGTVQDVESSMVALMVNNLHPVQRAAYMGELTDDMNILDFLMNQPGVVSRLSKRALQTDGKVFPLAGEPAALGTVNVGDGASVDASQLASTVAAHAVYFIKPDTEFTIRPVTHWLVADFNTRHGQLLALEAVRRMLHSDTARVAFLHNPSSTQAAKVDVYGFMHAIGTALTPSQSLQALGQLLVAAINGKTSSGDLLEGVKESRRTVVQSAVSNAAVFASVSARYAREVLQLLPGQSALLANMKLVGPLDAEELLLEADYKAIETRTIAGGAGKLRDAVQSIPLSLDPDSDTATFRSTLILKVSSLLGRSPASATRFNMARLAAVKPAFTLQSEGLKDDAPRHEVLAIIDPLSDHAQVLAPLLSALLEHTAVRVQVILNPKQRLSEPPIKRFFRLVLPSLQFAANGSLLPGPSAVFHNMPTSSLLTMGMHTPPAWMVQVVQSLYDLDNIHLEAARSGVRALYKLGHLLVEGSCLNADNYMPARGLQLQLGTASNALMSDTIVMANLGYFQLKALPGAWRLQLRSGRSRDIFRMDPIAASDTHSDEDVPIIVLDDFNGRWLEVRVRRRPGMERARLLDADGGDDVQAAGGEGKGLWNSFSNLFSAEKSVATGPGNRTGEVINVFSIASGHLYERFMKIMMLSVLRNTRNPVKFWFLESCMSPQFKSFLPHFSAAYGFDYALVQYNWPAWLNRQSEKQRFIWGYKILFLDVLFPLDVKKIIFVDADQVVRADLKELLDMDLEGAPYAYTPFCDSREEMDGFRFWKQGYWASHLAGRPYHISALYVVDLVRFREYAAGDRLREQYQGLSRDPNSLSNLDQDLPNNMIHQVPIKSLPQEWLYCETWCSEATKARAKTIDLCNNPKTKEPKLKAAVRIVSEWAELDQEARNFTLAVVSKKPVVAGAAGTKDGTGKAHEDL